MVAARGTHGVEIAVIGAEVDGAGRADRRRGIYCQHRSSGEFPLVRRSLGRLDTPKAVHREASMELANIQEQPAFLTPMQCAAKLQLSRWTIYHWISGGKLGTEQG